MSVSTEERGVSLNLAWSNNSILSGESMGDVGTPQRLPFGLTTNPQLCPHLHHKRQICLCSIGSWMLFEPSSSVEEEKQTHSVVLFALCNYLMPPVPECILCCWSTVRQCHHLRRTNWFLCREAFRLTHKKKSTTCQKKCMHSLCVAYARARTALSARD